MNYISPTRVSVYDFLYQDTLPLTPLLADIAQLSYPQAKIALQASLQAIVSALLAYHQHQDSATLIKKLLLRNVIKDLRQFNAMNFVTIEAAMAHRQTVADSLFMDSQVLSQSIDSISQAAKAPAKGVQILLTTLTVICLRELAILVDYAHLEAEEVDEWLALQPQFLAAERFIESPIDTVTQDSIDTSLVSTAASNSQLALAATPKFNPQWFLMTKFTVPNANAMIPQPASSDDGVPHYAKVIGRSVSNASQSLHNELLSFAPMAAISLPHQRWLLQLAKISDVYLSRQRLKIASEPKAAPSRPLVNLGLMGNNNNNTPITASETPIVYDSPAPLWRNPVILLIVIIIGGLGTLALFKYQAQLTERTEKAAALRDQSDARAFDDLPQDVAIVRVDDSALPVESAVIATSKPIVTSELEAQSESKTKTDSKTTTDS
ncbi:MAG: hypothetical protein Q4P13_06115, partial [Psychrobacter sp.]|nr:hypothetical protein [Psychrobacter sp.]